MHLLPPSFNAVSYFLGRRLLNQGALPLNVHYVQVIMMTSFLKPRNSDTPDLGAADWPSIFIAPSPGAFLN